MGAMRTYAFVRQARKWLTKLFQECSFPNTYLTHYRGMSTPHKQRQKRLTTTSK